MQNVSQSLYPVQATSRVLFAGAGIRCEEGAGTPSRKYPSIIWILRFIGLVDLSTTYTHAYFLFCPHHAPHYTRIYIRTRTHAHFSINHIANCLLRQLGFFRIRWPRAGNDSRSANLCVRVRCNRSNSMCVRVRCVGAGADGHSDSLRVSTVDSFQVSG